MLNQIADYLQVSTSQIVRCDEWAKVYFVVVAGCRPTFISKKVIVMPKLSINATYSETVSHMKKLGIWNAPDRCSVWKALQLWINSSSWENTEVDLLIDEVNQFLELSGMTGYGVRECINSIVAFKLEANGCIFTFQS